MIIKEPKKYLTVPHEKGELTFQYPAFRGTYWSLKKQIESVGLKLPNSFETASLVYDAFQNQYKKYSQEIIGVTKNEYFREFTGNLYLPKLNNEINNGVILYDISEINLNESKKSLIKKLQENGESVKFVPFGFKTGEQSWQELEKNDYIIARYGEEGAEKIAEIASKYKRRPLLATYKSVHRGTRELSNLGQIWGSGDGLDVNGHDWGDGDNGYAFGNVKE